jgi:ubiquinone/menaquinone biosynthesis C-methylase UbiE
MSVVDLGCGPGHFTACLADWLPQATLIALDAKPEMLQLARKRLGDRVGQQITLAQAQAEATRLPADTYDFVIARLLFQHLTDPLSAAQEAWRILKPGGKLVITDVDDGLFGVVEPRVPGLARVLTRYGEAQAQRGGNRRIGRSLVRLLRTAGFIQVDIESIAIHSDEAGLAECFPQLDPAPLQSLVAAGHLSQQEYTVLREAYQAFLGTAEPFVLILLFMACGIKPDHRAEMFMEGA